jgi:uncharacterized protein (TIGR00251 family)
MRLIVRALPNSSKNSIEQISETELKIKVASSPTDGKANDAIIRLLSKHLKVPQSAIKIIRGLTSRNKIIEVDR